MHAYHEVISAATGIGCTIYGKTSRGAPRVFVRFVTRFFILGGGKRGMEGTGRVKQKQKTPTHPPPPSYAPTTEKREERKQKARMQRIYATYINPMARRRGGHFYFVPGTVLLLVFVLLLFLVM